MVGFFLKKDSIHNLTSAASYLRQAKWSSFFSSLFSHLSVLFGQKCDRYFCSGANVCVFRLAGKINAMKLFRECRSYVSPVRLKFVCVRNSLTPDSRRRKNRNIGGTAYTIKRAGVVNDSAPESCADRVFGAFFGGSASHQRVFFISVFF